MKQEKQQQHKGEGKFSFSLLFFLSLHCPKLTCFFSLLLSKLFFFCSACSNGGMTCVVIEKKKKRRKTQFGQWDPPFKLMPFKVWRKEGKKRVATTTIRASLIESPCCSGCHLLPIPFSYSLPASSIFSFPLIPTQISHFYFRIPNQYWYR